MSLKNVLCNARLVCQNMQVWFKQSVHSSHWLVPGEEPPANTTPRWAVCSRLIFTFIKVIPCIIRFGKKKPSNSSCSFHFYYYCYSEENLNYNWQPVWDPMRMCNVACRRWMFLFGFTDCCGFIILAASDYPDQGRFSWSRYLEETGSKAVAADAFNVVRMTVVYMLLWLMCLPW